MAKTVPIKKKPKPAAPKTNMERVRQIAATFGGEGGEWIKLKSGKNRIRILPAKTDDGSFFYSSVLHYGFSEGTDRRAYPCMRALGESKCPVCQVIGVHQDDTNPDVKNAIKQLSPKKRFIMNAIDRGEGDGTVKLFGVGTMIMKDVLGIFNDPDFDDITDVVEGRDITVEKEGSGFNTEYTARPAAKQSSVGVDDWADNLFDLEKAAYREIPTRRAYIQMLLDQYGDVLDIRSLFKKEISRKIQDEDDDGDEEEEEEKPAKSSKSVKRKRLVEPEEEEDEDEELLDDEEDEDDD